MVTTLLLLGYLPNAVQANEGLIDETERATLEALNDRSVKLELQYTDRCIGGYEVSYVHSRTSTTLIGCYDTLESGRTAMNSYKNNAHMGQVPTLLQGGKVLDTTFGLLDLYSKATTNAYFNTYANATTTSGQGYIHGHYGGDAAYLSQSGSRLQLLISEYTGYINRSDVHIVPVSALASMSHYSVTNGILYHRLASSIHSTSYQASLDQGNAPGYLQEGVQYFSFDGHYFYSNLISMLKDYQEGHRKNAINANDPYYNYYQFLNHRVKSNYGVNEISQFLANRGYTQKPGDHKTSSSQLVSNESLLVGEENALLYAQDRFGINAILTLTTAINESAWGRSEIAMNKRNLFGHNAVDSSPSSSANGYSGASDSIFAHASTWLSKGYLNAKTDSRYNGSHLGNKNAGINVKYASDPYWGEKAANFYFQFDRQFGMKDYQKVNIGIVTTNTPVNVRAQATTASAVLYQVGEGASKPRGLPGSPVTIIGEEVGESINGNNVWYKIVSDTPVTSDRLHANASLEYNYATSYAYIHSSNIQRVITTMSPDPSLPTGVKPTIRDGWNFFMGEWFYYTANQKQVGWLHLGDNTYYLDVTTGVMADPKGWKIIDGNRYYFYNGGSIAKNTEIGGYIIDKDGIAHTKPTIPNGWNNIGGYWYFYHFDVPQKGWLNDSDGRIFYLHPTTARMVTGWQTIDGNLHFFETGGAMLRNTEYDGYIFDDKGIATEKPPVKQGWTVIDGYWHYYQNDVLHKGWLHDTDGRIFYLHGTTGRMLTGWQTIEGNLHFFENGGAMLRNTEYDGYLFDDKGIATEKPPLKNGWVIIDGSWHVYKDDVLVKGWYVEPNGRTFYLHLTTGRMLTGWQTIESKRYYFESNGAMLRNSEFEGYIFDKDGVATIKPAFTNGWHKIDNVWYYYTSNVKRTGWLNEGSTKYYLDPTTGAMITGWKVIDGRWYYFYANGKMGTGWVHDGTDYFYLNPTGDMKIGWYLEHGHWFYLEKTGRMQTGWKFIDNVHYYFYGSGRMAVNTTIDDWIINGSGAARPK